MHKIFIGRLESIWGVPGAQVIGGADSLIHPSSLLAWLSIMADDTPDLPVHSSVFGRGCPNLRRNVTWSRVS